MDNEQYTNNLLNRKNTSWIFGIISIVSGFCGLFIASLTDYLAVHGITNSDSATKLGQNITLVYYGVVLIFTLIGFIKGIKELKLSDKTMAILGLLFCAGGIFMALLEGFFLATLFVID